jgi:hypothetical protein
MTTHTTDPTSSMIRVLMATEGEGQGDLAVAARISEATASRRLAHGGWKSDELRLIAQHYRIPIGVLYADPADVRDALRDLPPRLEFGWTHGSPPPDDGPYTQLSWVGGSLGSKDAPKVTSHASSAA